MTTKKKLLIALPVVLIVAAVAALYVLATREHAEIAFAKVTGPTPELSEPRETLLPTLAVAKAVGWKAGEKPVAARGLSVAAFAEGLTHPRWIYVLPNGDVLVSESNSPARDAENGGGGITGFIMNRAMARAGAGIPSPNRIILLRDADGDGKAELKTVLIAGLNSPSGMAWADGQLYIGNTDAVVRVPFTPGQTKIDAKPVVVTRLPGGYNHWARNLLLAPDGKSLYVAVGSASNIGERGMELETKRAAILQVALPSGKDRVFAYGLRNPNGMAYEPTTGDLWTVVNERDMLGSDMVPDYLTEVQLGGFYGWPWYYWGGVVDKRVPEPEDDLQSYVIRPDYALGPHVAALGLTFSEGAILGPDYASGAFIAEHGSWNRRPLSGYKLVFVPFAQGKPMGQPRDVLTGFLSPAGEARGRPVAVAIGKRGGLMITDDVGGKIWRVTAAAPAK
ncbi:sorbosone dehydrogenase family protein [Sphingomonas histidinilytica]|uniref:Glucose/arabinose dehydrogenase, beta-propeller fold n=1 Tax=Rhizorhabdus histidinilytica TaxID=439228 RepID=A0A1T5FEH9_9SPHN|nr:sorbosone dehydrogenase family protein [Rhizorhabdus histidinilytica]MBO9375726.1 sorbosone dehydrogenase family protein [Rhizorhabdus histidinilytica]QEH81241.1 sorbosone dehydrogenase family protein [Sphingomonas sp. C8-2]SKB94468.1 Glucose/arabinose dehydrogenase, beta-propeller fold [Rhizorhabdus histidinilytica]